ncbi:MAG: aldehyde dehydrogenase family protein [Candidatus Lokiarchaeota archaeon]|nr:aldehyde dehydrogenase family protein [Candidatus Lokiarchaeota archaeon]
MGDKNMKDSINPATLELNGSVQETSNEDLKSIFENARSAQKIWQKLPIEERARRVVEINKVMSTQYEEISNLISSEVGKPPSEAFTNEVYGVIDATFHYYSTVMETIGQKREIPLGFYESMEKKSYVIYKPLGVIAVIGPYNYPFAIPFMQIIQSLMAGNAVVFKPSSETILTGKKIQDIINETKLPQYLVQTIFGSGSELGNPLIDLADKVIFTGSTVTGKRIMERAAHTLTPVDLELGGKSAMIVFPDVNMERALSAVRWGVFTNSGQVCCSIKRLYLHEDIYDEFIDKLVKLTKELKQGIPTERGVDVGAMINLEQLELVDEMVQTGKNEGAKILIGGRRNPNLKGYFYEPTIIGNATNDMEIVQKEIFGPVLVVIKFSNKEEVIDMVNDNPYGLTSTVWTENIEFGKRIAEEINTGTVMINEVVYTFALAATPWGGTKESGIGRTHGREGFLEVVRPLHINVDRSHENDPWWFPYDEDALDVVENFKLIAKSLIVKDDE